MQIWEAFVDQLEKELGREATDRWIRSIKLLNFDAGNIYLQPLDPFHAAWVEEHLVPKMGTRLLTQTGKPFKIHLTPPNTRSRTKTLTPSLSFDPDPLDPSALLSTFVPGEANQLLLQFLSAPLTINPIYIYGGSGVGKTHLLMSLAHHLCSEKKRVLYVRTETFTHHAVQAIRFGQMGSFRSHYRNYDALLIDDVEQLARKPATQEEFFHTFNALHTSGKQLILTANVPPSSLEEIESRLVSRFEWGITFPLAPLAPEELKQVLLARSAELHFPLSDATVDFLLSTFQKPASLHRAFEALVIRTPTQPGRPASSLLSDLIAVEQKESLTPEKIIARVASALQLKPSDLLGKSQTQECSTARQIAMSLCRSRLSLSYAAIGRIFNRDHSTVISGIQKIDPLCKKDYPWIESLL